MSETIRWEQLYIGDIPTAYNISDNGDIQSRISGKILAKNPRSTGKYRCTLFIANIPFTVHVGYLVAHTFIKNPYNCNNVEYIDGNGLNDNYKNLKWVSGLDRYTPIERLHEKLMEYEMSAEDCYELNTGYDVEQIEEVCRQLSQTDNSYNKISMMTEVPINIICRIKLGKMWVNIANKYEVSKSRKRIAGLPTDDQIRHACKLLEEEKLTYKEISLKTGISTNSISNIVNKRQWSKISSQYQIRSRYNVKKCLGDVAIVENIITGKIEKLLLSGKSIDRISAILKCEEKYREYSMESLKRKVEYVYRDMVLRGDL